MSKHLSGVVVTEARARIRALTINEFELFTFDEFVDRAFAGWERVARTKTDPTFVRYLYSRPGEDGGTQWALFAPQMDYRFNGEPIVKKWIHVDISVRLSLLMGSLRFPDVVVGASAVEIYDLVAAERRVAVIGSEQVGALSAWLVSKLTGFQGDALRTLHALSPRPVSAAQ